jgi:kynureninase
VSFDVGWYNWLKVQLLVLKARALIKGQELGPNTLPWSGLYQSIIALKVIMTLADYQARARELDDRDGLAFFRLDFHLPAQVIYLDGNSLGPLPRAAEQAVLRVLDEWKMLGIGGWMGGAPPWFTMAEEAARLMAPLVGAEPNEVLIANSTTVNLHQLLATLYRPDGRRMKILADELAFPTDLYALRSHLLLRGRDPLVDLPLVRSRDGLTLAEEDIMDAMTQDVQLAVLPSVLYASGQLLDMPKLARHAHQNGILIGFDCCHSIGAIPHQLSEWDVDFAFWCTYKYLNSGPGGIGGLYLNRRHFGRVPGLAGWFGCRKDRQFDMAPDFEAAPDAQALQIGTPHILSLAPLLGALSIHRDAGMPRLRQKSLRLTGFLMELADTRLGRYGFTIATPKDESCRGGHVALVHPEALRICKALHAAAVVPDFRPPRIVRLAPAALYTSFQDCSEAIVRLEAIMEGRAYERQDPQRALIP